MTTSGFDESLEEVNAYSLAIVQEALRGKCTAILCDETRLEYRLGTLDTYRSAEFIAAQAPRLGKAAIVCNEQFIQDASFWKNVAVNRGLMVQVFKTSEAARKWLAE